MWRVVSSHEHAHRTRRSCSPWTFNDWGEGLLESGNQCLFSHREGRNDVGAVHGDVLHWVWLCGWEERLPYEYLLLKQTTKLVSLCWLRSTISSPSCNHSLGKKTLRLWPRWEKRQAQVQTQSELKRFKTIDSWSRGYNGHTCGKCGKMHAGACQSVMGYHNYGRVGHYVRDCH